MRDEIISAVLDIDINAEVIDEGRYWFLIETDGAYEYDVIEAIENIVGHDGIEEVENRGAATYITVLL